MRIKLLLLTLITSVAGFAQPAANYYTASTLDGKNGRELELALKAIVNNHTRISYDDLWGYYPTTDPGPTDSIPSSYTGGKTDLVWDMYAWMGQFPKFYSDNDHSQTGGFNREHAVPNSWWGGKPGNTYAYSDLHHLMPADGAANSVAKNDNPLGERVDGMTLGWPIEDKKNSSDVTYVLKDGSASHRWDLPTSMRSSYGGATSVFEPADEYKGDFARMYFYVVCTYEGLLNWQTNYMFTNESDVASGETYGYTEINNWAKELLLKWHRQDPVSKKERDRNNAVETIQHNRNPFIDYPELIEYIWGNKSDATDFALANATNSYKKVANIGITLHTKLGSNFRGFLYSSDSNGNATYSSSNTNVAEVDETTGSVTIKAVGEVVITYSVPETELFNAATESYKIIVDE